MTHYDILPDAAGVRINVEYYHKAPNLSRGLNKGYFWKKNNNKKKERKKKRVN